MSRKCRFTLLIYALFSLGSLAAMRLFLLFPVNRWVGVGIGAGGLILSLTLFLVCGERAARRSEKVSFVFAGVNSLAVGLAMSSLFTHFGMTPTPLFCLALWAGGAMLFALYCSLTSFPALLKTPYLWIVGYLFLILAGCIAATVFFPLFWLSILLFLPFASFLFALAIPAPDRTGQAKNLAVLSYAALFVVVVVVLLVLSEGDFDLSGLSPDGGSSGASPRRDPYDYAGASPDFM